MASVVLRCASKSLSSTLQSIAARRVLNVQVQAVRSYHLSRNLLGERKYTSEHEWVEVNNGNATVGVSNYAQEKLGDIVYVQLPEVDDQFDKDAEFGALESVKAASDLYSPLTGKITEVNTKLNDDPSLVNSSPYEEGWIVKMTIDEPSELDGLMDEHGYQQFTQSLED